MNDFSWTYFFHTHNDIGLLGVVVVSVVIIALLLFVYVKFISKRIKLPAWTDKIITYFLAFLIFPILFGILGFVSDLNKGGITDFYITTNSPSCRLVVWHTRRTSSGHTFSGYSHSFTNYNLSTGEQLGKIVLDKPYSSYNKLHIKRINDSLALGSIDSARCLINFNSMRIITNTEDYDFEHSEPLQQADDYSRFAFTENWKFYSTSNYYGQHVHYDKTPFSPESITLLQPYFVEELNPSATSKNKVWVMHKSRVIGNFHSLCSLIIPDGTEIKRYNLNKLFPEKENLDVIGTYTTNKLTFIFITAGKSYYKDIKGYMLSALVFESNTGRLLKRIYYF